MIKLIFFSIKKKELLKKMKTLIIKIKNNLIKIKIKVKFI